MNIADIITTEVQYTDDEQEFLRAMSDYQHRYKRRFPTYREVFAVLRSLGYRRTETPETLPVFVKKANSITSRNKKNESAHSLAGSGGADGCGPHPVQE